jgi:hypothetical protein
MVSADLTAVDEEVIACLLSERDQAERAAQARRELFPGVLEIEELADGYGYRFPVDDEWTARVMAVVAAERKCCPFLTFEIVFAPYGRHLWLRFRGSAAIKAFIRDNFPLTPNLGGTATPARAMTPPRRS